MNLLRLHPYHLSEPNARKRVVEVLASAGIKEPVGGWYKASVNIGDKKTIPITELVREMRLTGVIKEVQQIIDHADPVFGGTLSLATTSSALALSLKHRDYEIRVPGPSLIMPIDDLIVEDILYFRKFTCEHSDETNFEVTSRYFRSYIFSCVAMIEHFMHRHLLAALSNSPTKNDAELILNYRGRFTDRMDLWLQLFTSHNLSQISSKVEWSDFIKLKDIRNKLIHGTEPYFAFAIRDMASYLNCVRNGVGGLMRLVRDLQNRPSLMIIERLRTAPPVKYISNGGKA